MVKSLVEADMLMKWPAMAAIPTSIITRIRTVSLDAGTVDGTDIKIRFDQWENDLMVDFLLQNFI